MSLNTVSRLGIATETAQESNASQTDHHDTPAGTREIASNNASDTIEHRLLAQMMTPDGMALVAETGIQAEVFEDPQCRWMFDFMRNYQANGGTPPTALVMQTEFPSVSLPRAEDVEETAAWLCERLAKRHETNRGQDIIRRSAKLVSEDPAAALRFMEERAKQAREQAGRTGPPHLRDRLLSVRDLANVPPVRPLINGLLYRDTLAQIAGPPGCYKSFVAIGMACSVATGEPFAGTFTVPQAGRVVYVAAEGASGVRARMLAWCEAHGVDPDALDGQLFVLPYPIQLGDAQDVAQALEIVADLDADLVIVDTRARSTVGLEENSATDQGRAIAAADQIRNAAGCTVFGVHHAARNGTAGRGSNAWDGAVWSDLHMEGDGLQGKIRCAKHKDVADGCDHHFTFRRHTVSRDLMPGAMELQRQTLVISGSGAGISELRANSQLVVLEIVRNSAPPEGFTAPQVVDLAKGLHVSKSSVYTALNALLETGELVNAGTSSRSRYVARSGGH